MNKIKKSLLTIVTLSIFTFLNIGCTEQSNIDESASLSERNTISIKIEIPLTETDSSINTESINDFSLNVVGGPGEITDLRVDVKEGSTSVLSNQAMTFETSTDSWQGTLTGLPTSTSLEFFAYGLNSSLETIYSGSTFKTLTGDPSNDSPLSVSLAPTDNQTYSFPQISKISRSQSYEANQTGNIRIYLAGTPGDELSIEIINDASGGIFSPSTLTIPLTGSTASFITNYTASSSTGQYFHTVKVSNKRDLTVETQFDTTINAVGNPEMKFAFYPTILAITTTRNGNDVSFDAEVTDDSSIDAIIYEWRFDGADVSFDTSVDNPTSLTDFPFALTADNDTTHDIELKITDNNGASGDSLTTTLHFIIKENTFPLINNNTWTGTIQNGSAQNDNINPHKSLFNFMKQHPYIDSSKNIYLIGTTEGNFDDQTLIGNKDIFIVKYDYDGIKQWANQVGTAAKDTTLIANSLDNNANLFILSRDETADTTADHKLNNYLDSDGNSNWDISLGTHPTTVWSSERQRNLTQAPLVGIGELGYLYTLKDRLTQLARYNNNSTPDWDITTGIDPDFSEINLLKKEENNLYLTGFGRFDLSTDTTSDFILLKYDLAGNKIFAVDFNSTDTTPDVTSDKDGVIISMAVSSTGNLYLAGMSLYDTSPDQWQKIFVAKIPSDSTGDGEIIYEIPITVAASDSKLIDLAFDTSGDIYLTGQIEGIFDASSTNGLDAFVLKMNSSGVKLWSQLIGDGSDNYNYGFLKYNNNNGNDESTDKLLTDKFYLLTAGSYPTLTKHNLITGNSDASYDFDQLNPAYSVYYEIDQTDDIYLVGRDLSDDIKLEKVNLNLTSQWNKTIGDPAQADTPKAIMSDEMNNLLIMGETLGAIDGNTNKGNQDIFLIKYDKEGNKL